MNLVVRALLGLSCTLASLLPAASASAAEEVAELPGLVVSLNERLTFDDNLFRLSDSARAAGVSLPAESSVDDVTNQASLSVAAHALLGRQQFTVAAQLADNRFSRNDALDSLSGTGIARWDWQLGRRLAGQLAAQRGQALAGFADTGFYGRDLLTTQSYSGTFRYAIGPSWRITGGAWRAGSSHSAPVRTVDDYASTAGSAGLEYETDAGTVLGADFRRAVADFDRETVLSGLPFDRDYDEDLVSLRAKYALAAKLALQASAGHVTRSYPNSGIADVSGGVWRATLRWTPTAKSRVELAGWRELTANADVESDYYVSRGASVNPSWSPTLKVTVVARASWEKHDYIGSAPATSLAPRHDELKMLSLGVDYALRKAFLVSIGLRSEERTSNRMLRDYDTWIGSLALRYTW